MSHHGFDANDHRTLRLAVPEFTPELLERYIRYQEECLRHAGEGRVDEVRLSDGHVKGLEATGLSSEDVGKIGAVVRAYAGTISTIRRLEKRREELLARVGGLDESAAASERELAARLELETKKLGTLDILISRYGKSVIEVLSAREGKLLELHERTSALFR